MEAVRDAACGDQGGSRPLPRREAALNADQACSRQLSEACRYEGGAATGGASGRQLPRRSSRRRPAVRSLTRPARLLQALRWRDRLPRSDRRAACPALSRVPGPRLRGRTGPLSRSNLPRPERRSLQCSTNCGGVARGAAWWSGAIRAPSHSRCAHPMSLASAGLRGDLHDAGRQPRRAGGLLCKAAAADTASRPPKPQARRSARGTTGRPTAHGPMRRRFTSRSGDRRRWTTRLPPTSPWRSSPAWSAPPCRLPSTPAGSRPGHSRWLPRGAAGPEGRAGRPACSSRSRCRHPDRPEHVALELPGSDPEEHPLERGA